MRGPHSISTDSVLRKAAWAYLTPRAVIGLLVLAMLGLAAVLVILQVAISFLRQLGA